MPAVQQKVRGEVGVKTWTKAALYVANEVIRVWLIILQQRGLANQKLLQDKEVIHNGLFTWLTTHHLERAAFEMYQEGEYNATERWDMIFKYADPNKEDVTSQEDVDSVWKTYLDEVSEFMRQLSALPVGTTYRVVVSLKDRVFVSDDDKVGHPPPEVEGWSPTTLRNVDHLQRHKFGEDIIVAGGKINVGMEFWGKIS